ncbi:hypothetical protein N8865_01930 [Francisellaceae bacterium]|nr:hypothetical protein [Francisellaceae bacterium]
MKNKKIKESLKPHVSQKEIENFREAIKNFFIRVRKYSFKFFIAFVPLCTIGYFYIIGLEVPNAFVTMLDVWQAKSNCDFHICIYRGFSNFLLSFGLTIKFIGEILLFILIAFSSVWLIFCIFVFAYKVLQNCNCMKLEAGRCLVRKNLDKNSQTQIVKKGSTNKRFLKKVFKNSVRDGLIPSVLFIYIPSVIYFVLLVVLLFIGISLYFPMKTVVNYNVSQFMEKCLEQNNISACTFSVGNNFGYIFDYQNYTSYKVSEDIRIMNFEGLEEKAVRSYPLTCRSQKEIFNIYSHFRQKPSCLSKGNKN